MRPPAAQPDDPRAVMAARLDGLAETFRAWAEGYEQQARALRASLDGVPLPPTIVSRGLRRERTKDITQMVMAECIDWASVEHVSSALGHPRTNIAAIMSRLATMGRLTTREGERCKEYRCKTEGG